MEPPNLQEIHDLFIKIAHQAGEMMLNASPSTRLTTEKVNSADFVTETDKAIEKMASATLLAAYPSFEFIGEETYKPGMTLSDAPTFIVDPIDGTTNFVHGFPFVCISLGLSINKIPTIGVLYNPFLDELYTAIKGNGSFLTARSRAPVPLPFRSPSPLHDLSSALGSAEWGTDRLGANFDLKVEVYRKLAAAKASGGSMVHSLRAVGSAALNIAAVATGALDFYWEGGPWPWDVCGAWCVLVEAGGIIASGNPGGSVALDGRSFLAVRAAPSGQQELVREFWGVIGEGKLVY